MRRTPMVQLDGLTVSYGPARAVDGVGLRVDGGEIYGLLGPNGSGKSSTLAAIAGLLRPASGSVTVDGLCAGKRPAEYARRIGFVPQEIALYEEFTPRENLAFFGRLYGLGGTRLHERAEACLEMVRMGPQADQAVGTLSGGMQRRVNVACALLHDPAVLLLDEPTAALDPESRDVLFDTLATLRNGGKAIVLTTHHLDEAERWCDRAGILCRGKLVAEGRPAALFGTGPRRAILLGQLRRELPGRLEILARARLGAEVEFAVEGRQVRLEAANPPRLAQAMAALFAAGVELESFRTPPACLNRVLADSDGADAPEILPFPSREGTAWAA